MLLLYFLLWTAVAANKEPLYKKIGDEAVLTSDSVVNPITSIEWKHGPDLAIEWYGGEITAYRHFRDRGSLNTSTGALTITGLTQGDSGIYTVEINNKVTSKTQLLVISPVSKPTLSIRCEPEKTYCVLTCNGDTTGAEPVTYRWTSGDMTWSSTKEHNITMEDNELWFSCAFENPVSFISSEKVRNPFNKEPLYRKIGDKAVLTPDSVVNPIKSIAWTHGPSIAIEWFRNGDETSAYRQFKDRGSLNTSTGALTITGLTPDDSGNYTVEINDKVTSKTELLVISLVSKPTISDWCVMTYCILTCNGDTAGAEPVTYWWTSGNTTWSSTKEHKITKEDKEPWFSCAFENPVSFNSSEKVPNPFIKWVLIWTFIFTAVFILVGCIIIIIIYFRCTRRAREAQRTWQEFLQRWDKEYEEMLDKVNSKISEINKTSTQDLETAESPDTSNETGEAAERARQEMLNRLRKEFLERLAEGDADEWTQQAYLQRRREGDYDHWQWQGQATETRWQEFLQRWDKEYLERKRKGEAERRWQEFQERLAKAYLQRRREGAHERARQEYLERWDKVNSKISEINKKSTQDPTSVVTQDTSNETERPASLVVVQETSTQDPTSVVTQDTSNGTVLTERPASLIVVQETSNQDTISTGPPETSKETEMLEMVPLKKASTQDTTSTVPPETSKETERSTTSPDVPETSTQDQETAESSDPSNETEESPIIPDVPETCRLLIDEQTADPQDEAQS